MRNEAAAGEMGLLLEERRPVRRNGDGQELSLRRIQGVLRVSVFKKNLTLSFTVVW